MARDAGHQGYLCGLDPAPGMIEQARKHDNIHWVLGDISTVTWEDRFDLVVMTGHAFQVLVTDSEVRHALGAIPRVLTEDGHFMFETRNPRVREWEDWTPSRVSGVTTETGAVVLMHNCVEEPVESDVVSFTTTFESPDWPEPRVSHSTLRFLDVDQLASFLSDAGLVIEEQFGDFDHETLTEACPEIITIARPL